MAVTKIGHVALNVTDLELAVEHYTATMGLAVTARQDGCVYLRAPGDQDHHCVQLRESDRASLTHVGLKVGHADDLEELEGLAERSGGLVRRIAAGEQAGIGEGIAFRLPSEHEVWAYHQIENLGWAEGMQNPDPVPQDWTADTIRASRLDHIALSTADTAELAGFLTEVLDFESSEVLVGPDGRMTGAWMFCTNTMHDVAIVPGPNSGLHHVAFYAENRAAVVNGIDVLRHRGVATMNYGMTRHGIGGVTTTYFHDPAGIRNELFYGPYATPGVPGKVPPIVWEAQEFGRGGFYYENEVDIDFMTQFT